MPIFEVRGSQWSHCALFSNFCVFFDIAKPSFFCMTLSCLVSFFQYFSSHCNNFLQNIHLVSCTPCSLSGPSQQSYLPHPASLYFKPPNMYLSILLLLLSVQCMAAQYIHCHSHPSMPCIASMTRYNLTPVVTGQTNMATCAAGLYHIF